MGYYDGIESYNPKKIFRRLIWAYKWQLFRSVPRHYLDKSHPNIWLAENLKEEFPTALFVGIERDPFATVASMIKHRAVSDWHRRWREFPIPNRFLGISEELASKYDQIPFAKKCALRWVAHHNEMNNLKKSLKGSLIVLSYECFIQNTSKELSRLQSFLKLSSPIPIPKVKNESLYKWRTQLSQDEIEQISEVVRLTQ